MDELWEDTLNEREYESSVGRTKLFDWQEFDNWGMYITRKILQDGYLDCTGRY